MNDDKLNYINLGIQTADLVKRTLGPKGMNNMVMGNFPIITNDGATIMKNVKLENPIGQMFRNLAISQEEAVGDGTTTSVILAGSLLENSLPLLHNIHPTILINGYNLAMNEAINYLNKNKKIGDKESMIKTCFGSKISSSQVSHFTDLILQVNDLTKFALFKNKNSDPLKSELINGYMFGGYTINDRMKNKYSGRIAVLELKSNIEYAKVNLTSADEVKKLKEYDRAYRNKIINRLKELNIGCVFTSDINPEFESALTEAGIMGIVTYKRENLDGICHATGAKTTSNEDLIEWGNGEVEYVKPQKILIKNDDSQIQTLIVNGNTEQTLDEISRSIDDVMGILKFKEVVYGAGNIEIALSLHLSNFAKKIGGKEQLAIEAFSKSLETIPMQIAENCGLDSIEVITNLKTLYSNGQTEFGVDAIKKISSVKDRNIYEPVEVKIHAISSATQLVNLILKLDKILVGDNNGA